MSTQEDPQPVDAEERADQPAAEPDEGLQPDDGSRTAPHGDDKPPSPAHGA
ncbi:hypothetical protein [Conexibacter sp. SYSU D00693]|uniref:hypothetical protein n=1 Tax=Conexibacter sp. SYSU D00693 TaxID=2812560 RepID=UPI00196B3D08|nr:hypothetical protein [Conexibacter sp. SYSU D00693]